MPLKSRWSSREEEAAGENAVAAAAQVHAHDPAVAVVEDQFHTSQKTKTRMPVMKALVHVKRSNLSLKRLSKVQHRRSKSKKSQRAASLQLRRTLSNRSNLRIALKKSQVRKKKHKWTQHPKVLVALLEPE